MTAPEHDSLGLLNALRTPAAFVDSAGVVRNSNLAFAKMMGFRLATAIMGQAIRKWVRSDLEAHLSYKLSQPVPFVMADAFLTALTASDRPNAIFVPMAPGWLVQLSVPWSAGQAVSAEFPEFVAGVAHEINNPLAFAIPALHDAIELVSDADSAQHRAGPLLEQVANGLNRIESVVRDLHSFRATTTTERVCDVNSAVVEAVKLVRGQARLVRFSWDLGTVADARGDAGPLGQVLLNLLTNAADILSQRPVGRVNHVVVRTWEDEEYIQIQVSDNGPGMDPELVSRVFDPFVSRRAGGTGLGLTVCANLVRAMGGHISVSSALDKGSTFTVRLRPASRPTGPAPEAQPSFTQRASRAPTRAPAVRKERASERPEANPAQSAQDRPTIVIVDDEPLVRRALSRRLRGMQVIEFESGNDVIAWLESGNSANAILCDRVMARGDGESVLNWVQQHRTDLLPRFVFMTGAAPEGTPSLQKTPVLQKPFSSRAISELVDQLLNRAPPASAELRHHD